MKILNIFAHHSLTFVSEREHGHRIITQFIWFMNWHVQWCPRVSASTIRVHNAAQHHLWFQAVQSNIVLFMSHITPESVPWGGSQGELQHSTDFLCLDAVIIALLRTACPKYQTFMAQRRGSLTINVKNSRLHMEDQNEMDSSGRVDSYWK